MDVYMDVFLGFLKEDTVIILRVSEAITESRVAYKENDKHNK